MSTPTRLAAFAVGALAAFGAAFGVGRAVGPIGQDDPDHQPSHTEQEAPAPGSGSDADPTATTHTAAHEGEGSQP